MNQFDALSFHCINLDRRTDRWEHVQEQFRLIGIHDRVVRVSAVTDFIERVCELSKAEQSLVLTNSQIIKGAESSGPVCIFEDDVYFLIDSSFKNIMNSLFSQLPDNYGILYLGAHLFDPKIKHPLVSSNLVRLIPELRPSIVKDHVFVGGAHAVVYSRSALEYIRTLPEEVLFEKQWDVLLAKHLIPRFPCFMAYPPFAFQIEDISDLEGKLTKRDWIIEHNKTSIRRNSIFLNSLITSIKFFWDDLRGRN